MIPRDVDDDIAPTRTNYFRVSGMAERIPVLEHFHFADGCVAATMRAFLHAIVRMRELDGGKLSAFRPPLLPGLWDQYL